MGLEEVPVMVTGRPVAAASAAVLPAVPFIMVSRPTALPPTPRLVSTFMLRLKFNAPLGETVPLPTASPIDGIEIKMLVARMSSLVT